MNRSLFLFLFTFPLMASAGFPPTTTKASGDSSNVVTFNFAFPNMSVTRSGVTTTFNLLNPAGGGTGTSTVFTHGSVVFAGSSGIYSQDNTNFFWDATNHRLGIGTTGPLSSVDITGGLAVGSSAATAVASTGVILADKIGIGTTNTAAGSAVFRKDSTTNGIPMVLQNLTGGPGDTAETVQFRMQLSGDGSTVSNGSFLLIGKEGDFTSAGTKNAFFGVATATSGVLTEKFRVTSAGHLGIGTTGPLSLLDVNGGTAIGSYAGTSAAPTNGLIVSGQVGLGIVTVNGGTQAEIFDSTRGQAFYATEQRTTGTNYGFQGEATGAGATQNNGGFMNASGATTNIGFNGIGSGFGATTNIGGIFSGSQATNNYGVEIIAPNSGANNYALYSPATAQSYFAGSIGIGTATPGSTLHDAGSYQGAVNALSANVALDDTNQFITEDATGGSVTVTIPACVTNIIGRVYHVKKIDSSANTITVARSSSDTIDGATSYVISVQYQANMFVCTAAGVWSIF